jgi:hypothetical protein
MTPATARLVGLCTAALGLCALTFAQKDAGLPAPRTQDYTGKVVPLAKLLDKLGSKLDADAAPHWLALVTDDGKVYPLIKDAGARRFFKDDRLLDRPMRLTGRLYPDTHLLQVIQVHSLLKGAAHELYYWCEICAIRRDEKDLCDCCGGPMELREPPVGK